MRQTRTMRGTSLLPFMSLALSGCLIVWATTSGYHRELPPPGTVVMLWTADPVAGSTARAWLKRRGLTFVERYAGLTHVMQEQRIRLLHTPDREADLMKIGGLLGAQQVIFLEIGADGNDVLIRGVSVDTAKVQWEGSAYWPMEVMGSFAERVSRLTCHALATAWGYRPPGNRWILSDSMCEVDNGHQ